MPKRTHDVDNGNVVQKAEKLVLLFRDQRYVWSVYT